jgi:predicted ATPase
LTDIIHQQTQGNPFFVNEVLHHLYQEGFIFFDQATGTWRWELDHIAQANMTTHVVDFMTDRLKKLPPATQSILQFAACIGNQFDVQIVSMLTEKSLPVTLKNLWEAVRAGLLLPLNADVSHAHFLDEDDTDASFGPIHLPCRFRHDRIQQAAYALVPGEHKPEVHLHIGRLMQQQFDDQGQQEHIVEIVHQLNEGRQLLSEASERLELDILDHVPVHSDVDLHDIAARDVPDLADTVRVRDLPYIPGVAEVIHYLVAVHVHH